MMKQKTLSEKKVKLDMCDCDKEAYWEEDIKEAVQKENDLLILLGEDKITFDEFLNKRDEIFGEDLR